MPSDATNSDGGSTEYAVGYGKPPKHTQFKKGQSGNSKGRPKGSKNFATVIQEELNARVVVNENGKRRKISKREAVVKQLVNRAAAGDPKAIPTLLNEARQHEDGAQLAVGAFSAVAQEDHLVMESMLRRLRAADQSAPPTDSQTPPAEDQSPISSSPQGETP